MPADQRRPGVSVIQRLLEQPARFDFFQAVRLWQRWLGVDPERYLRFHNSLSLGFPPSQIEKQWCEDADGRALTSDVELERARLERSLLYIHITPAFMGFLGQHGVLPAHYTEAVSAYERQYGDPGPRAWLDSLSHRAVSLFYQAWARHRPECGHGDSTAPGFLAMQSALAGAWPASRAAAPGPDSAAIARHAALLRQRPVSAAVMHGVLADYFQVPVALHRFIAEWYPSGESALGDSDSILGGGARLGPCCRRCDLLIEIRLGPLNREQYEDFLPRGSGAQALEQWLSLFAVPLVRYRVRLVLQAAAVRPARLASGDRHTAVRLGVDTVLHTAQLGAADRDDMVYEIVFPGSVLPRRPS